jgi:hypothetical protein
MRRRWFEVLLGLAVLPSTLLTSLTRSVSNTFVLSAEADDRALVTLQTLPKAPEEHRLIFDSSDSRRPLEDWLLEDYVLVATVEGSLYALDRYSGATKWVLKGDGAAVRSVGNITRGSWREHGQPQSPRWIVQPAEGGQLFLFEPQFGVVVVYLKRENANRSGIAIDH